MKKIQLQPAEGIAIADPEAEIRVEKIGYGNVLVLCEAEHMAIGVAHVIFHDSTQNAKTSIINPMTYGDLAVEGLIQQMLKTHEAYAELTQETLAPRLGAVLVGGCRPLVGTALKKLHPSELDISPRTTENIKVHLRGSAIPLHWELTAGANRRSMQIRGNRMTIAEEDILNREPTVSEIAIKFPEWHLTRGGKTKKLA